jgi:hypothetical protein
MGKGALAYGDRLAWRVIPLHYPIESGGCSCAAGLACPHPGKHPRIERWETHASSNRHRIVTWWAQHPHSNVGLLCGPAFWVFDADDLAALDALEHAHVRLPATVRQYTGRPTGGLHLLFQPAAGIGTSRGALPAGFDVRGQGGLIVAAPSRHASGNIYRWDPVYHPLRHPIAEAPGWLLELIRARPAPASSTSTHWSEFLAADCPERTGGRNQALTRLIGHLLAHCHKPEEARAIAALWNQCRCRPPLEAQEFDRTVSSMVARHRRQTEGG